MHPTLAHFIMLGAFLLGAKFFSFLAKRPVDGAFGYLVSTGVLVLIAVIQIFNPDVVPSNERAYVLGTLTAALALPVGLALYLSIRHHARRRAALSGEAPPQISATLPAEAPAERPPSVAVPRLKAPWYLPLLMLGWQLRGFWNGRKSLAAAFWGAGRGRHFADASDDSERRWQRRCAAPAATAFGHPPGDHGESHLGVLGQHQAQGVRRYGKTLLVLIVVFAVVRNLGLL